MSAKRYRMALEAILILSPYSDGSAMQKIAAKALEGTPAPAATVTLDVTRSNVTVPRTMPAPPTADVAADAGQDADKPEPIDLAAIDAELDAELDAEQVHCEPQPTLAPPELSEPSGVGEGADGGAAQAGERTAAPSAPPPAPAVGALPRAERRTAVRRDSKQPAIVAALREMGEATGRELAERVGVSTADGQLRKLVDDGTVVIVGKRPRSGGRPGRGYKVYALREPMDAKVAQLGARGKGRGGPGNDSISRRAEVLACIREGAGLVDGQEIALQLGMHREHVAEATGALLGASQVALRPDGTYVDAAESEAA